MEKSSDEGSSLGNIWGRIRYLHLLERKIALVLARAKKEEPPRRRLKAKRPK